MPGTVRLHPLPVARPIALRWLCRRGCWALGEEQGALGRSSGYRREFEALRWWCLGRSLKGGEEGWRRGPRVLGGR